MSLSLILACLWIVGANVIAMMPSRDQHWRAAYGLMAVGLPILLFVLIEHGFWIALVLFVAAASVLRWPVIYFGRWVKRQVGGRGDV